MKILNIVTAVIALALVAGACNHGGSSSSASPVLSRIGSGDSHTCFIEMTGAVECWGNNYEGQLGNGTTRSSTVSVSVVEVDGSTSEQSAIQVSVGIGSNYGESHTCALLETKALKCWGYNSDGQLGTGTSSDSTIPVSVIGINGSTSETSAMQVSLGDDDTCATLETGAVKCWGRNNRGQLGNGTKGNSYVPVSVIGIDGLTPETSAIQVSVGQNHTCATLETGVVKCWGYNGDGQLGNGTSSDSVIPVSVIGIDGSIPETSAVQVSSGGGHTCAMLETGAVQCWGDNEKGQLGDGTKRNSYVPVSVIVIDGLTPERSAMQVSLGYEHTCALLETKAIKCWGWNGRGQLGNGISDDNDESTIPVSVIGIDGSIPETSAMQVSLGDDHTCAILETEAVKCWGRNNRGQLGNGNTRSSSRPDFVTGETGGLVS